MKRYVICIMCLCIAITLFGCGKTADDSTNQNAPNLSLELNRTYTIPGVAKFSLFKIYTTPKVTPSMNATIGFDPETDDEMYIDIVLDWTSDSNESMKIGELATLYADTAENNRYTKHFISAETNNGTDLEYTGNVDPKTTTRIHCALAVPIDTDEVELTLQSNGYEFSCKYVLGTTLSQAEALSIGNEMEISNDVTFTLLGVEHTDLVRPSNTEKVHSHYSINDPDKTYLLVRFNICNRTTQDIDCDSFFNVTAQYAGSNIYCGFIVIEDEDGRGFGSDNIVSSMTKRHLYCLIEVPKDVTKSPLTVTTAINQLEYIYTT